MQVPQFILDDMIEAGRGGHCNIICTQPRRIAVRTTIYYAIMHTHNEAVQIQKRYTYLCVSC